MAIQTSPNPYGLNGAVVVTTTNLYYQFGPFYAVQCIDDTVFSQVSVNYGGDAIVGVTIPKGTVLYGDWLGFGLTSGKVIAYRSNF
jgi:hypothetical protein